MNILLWVLQAALALMYVAGGAYKILRTDDLVKQEKDLPRAIWPVVGVIEVIGGILLVIPARVTGVPNLIAIAATVLAVETLVLAAIYGRRSIKLVAANPFVWAAGMGLVVAFVAYGRYALA